MSALKTAIGDLLIVGLNTPTPGYFWRGKALTDITGCAVRHDDGMSSVKLRAQNTTAFDADYLEMMQAGIVVKKKND